MENLVNLILRNSVDRVSHNLTFPYLIGPEECSDGACTKTYPGYNNQRIFAEWYSFMHTITELSEWPTFLSIFSACVDTYFYCRRIYIINDRVGT